MSNYTILQQNTLAGLSEGAGHIYLAMCDTFQGHKPGEGERKAFLTACRYEHEAGELLAHILRNFPGFSDYPRQSQEKLERFIADRWRHQFIAKAKGGEA